MRLGLTAALGVALLAVAGCGGDDETRPLIAADKTAVVRGELVPDVHAFGDPVVARVEVVLDRSKVDPDDVRVSTDFDPYDKVGGTRVEREDLGDFTVLRYSTTLRCLTQFCIPQTFRGETTVSQIPGAPPFLPGQQRDEKVKYEFPPAVVVAEAGAKDKTLGRAVWPPLRSLSRINWYDSRVVGQGFPFVAGVTPVSEPDYRISPTVLGLGLLALALALLAVPGFLIWDRRRRNAVHTVDAGPAQSPLERALRLVEWASRRPSVDERREALEALAFELDEEQGRATATRARAQGWSPPPPQPEEMTELVSTIREDSDAPAT
jgi:hypothetical protein